MLKFSINGYEYTPIVKHFAGGEINLRIPSGLPGYASELKITAKLFNSDSIMQLFMLRQAIEAVYGIIAVESLYIPYLPYARQDRVCAEGEAFSLKVFAKLINGMEFDEVIIEDCHSEVGLALINNSRNISQEDIISRDVALSNKLRMGDYVIVAPDAGATKKAEKVAKAFGIKEVIQCLKIRDIATGAITETRVCGDIKGKKLMVVDDICDGGRTFIELGKSLASADVCDLFVTHGLFSRGKEAITPYYDTIHCGTNYEADLDARPI